MLAVEAWARQDVGDVREAIELLARAGSLAEGQNFSDVDRADILFRLGVCRYKLSSIATAVALFDEALKLAERSGLPCDLLRSEILNWRSRCRRRQRDYEAAREDVERALELAEGLDDRRMTAHVYFQASLIAEREGHWITARNYAERARGLYEEVEDQADVGRLLNNLGGLNYTLGKPDEAVRYLKDAFKVLIDLGRDDEAATAVSSLAQVRLGTGELTDRGGAGAPRADAPRRPRGPARRDRQRAARARPLAARAGPARRSGRRVRRGGEHVREVRVHEPSCRCVDREGRSHGTTGGRHWRCAVVPARRRSPAGLPVLSERR